MELHAILPLLQRLQPRGMGRETRFQSNRRLEPKDRVFGTVVARADMRVRDWR